MLEVRVADWRQTVAEATQEPHVRPPHAIRRGCPTTRFSGPASPAAERSRSTEEDET